MLEKLLSLGRRIIPRQLFMLGQPLYHWCLAVCGAVLYRFPAKKIKVVLITGTKGKSTTAELVNAVLEEAGFRTALSGTVRFKIADTTKPNLFKMTVQGRFFLQRFLRDAVDAHCDWAIVEMTSQAVLQFRHLFTYPDAFIFTNLSREHIESHGSYENYREAKLTIGRLLASSPKKDTSLIVNMDDNEEKTFLALSAHHKYTYSLNDAKPFTETTDGYTWTFRGTKITSHLQGLFNLSNMLAGAVFGTSQNITPETIAQAYEKFTGVRGRVEYVREGQAFDVVVDYAHTPDSLKAFYSIFTKTKNICILGNTGGGRDTWKRPEMAYIAEEHCDRVILTNEDPYDEDPQKIINEMADGIQNKAKLSIIMDRRDAIREALQSAHAGDAILITGKGTDPYIMEAGGKKTPWDDATVVREELKKLATIDTYGRRY